MLYFPSRQQYYPTGFNLHLKRLSSKIYEFKAQRKKFAYLYTHRPIWVFILKNRIAVYHII